MKRKHKRLIACLLLVALCLILVPRLHKSKLNYDLHTAARQSDAEATKSLLAAGADVNARYPGDGFGWVKAALLGNRYFSKTTPLIIAASRDHVDVVKLLLSKGADTEARDSENYTALMWAEELGRSGGYEKTIKLLKQHGAKSHQTVD
jgi:ankyrin repeat protein